MKRNISWVVAAFAAILLLAPAAYAQNPQPAAPQATPNAGPRLEGNDMVLGNPDAPVTIIEYASLTCPHCAAFSTGTMPQLQQNYIATGLVRFIYRDFPLDGVALRAAQLARCAGPERFFGLVEVFFRQQDQWARGRDVNAVVNNLRPLTRLAGMTDEQFDQCIANREVESAIIRTAMEGQAQGVDGTPAIFINGTRHRGAYTYDVIDQVLRPLTGRRS